MSANATTPVLTPQMRAEIEAFFPRYPTKQAVTLPALHVINEHLRCVPLEAIKSHQAVSAAAKKLDDLGVARPLRRAQSIEARDKFLNFLLGRFEAQICGFPRIRDKLARRVCFQSVGRIFHL